MAGMGDALSWGWEHRKEIIEQLKKVYAWFQGPGHGKHKGRILILGPGGTGKTTFARLLCGEYDWLVDPPGQYDESIEIEHYTLKGKPPVGIVVPPGQEHRREATWSELFAELAAGKFRGIVLLGAYGYHTLGQISYKHHRLFRGKREQFLADRRQEELQVLQQLGPHLRINSGKLWFLTVVTKQDLWWPERVRVEEHYQRGAYGQQMQGIVEQMSRQHFRHETVFASLVISNFKTGKGEQLQPNAEGYDQALQTQSLRRLLETANALKNGEMGK
jgi:hypothetical protein